MRTIGLALLLALGTTSGASAESYGLSPARVALSGKSPAAIIGVPQQFFRADGITSPADPITAGDWSYYFSQWLGSHRDRFNVVVITDFEIRRLFKSPEITKPCTTLFVREPGHGLIYDADCVPKSEVYEAGARWVQTGLTPEAKLGLRTVDFKLR
jgi:hypothetical protein